MFEEDLFSKILDRNAGDIFSILKLLEEDVISAYDQHNELALANALSGIRKIRRLLNEVLMEKSLSNEIF